MSMSDSRREQFGFVSSISEEEKILSGKWSSGMMIEKLMMSRIFADTPS